MFYSITGEVVDVQPQLVAVSCSGVAFAINTSMRSMEKASAADGQVTFYTYLSVRDDALELFGFIEREELDCFKKLIGVSGIGAKTALAVLSAMSPSQLAFSVAAGDVASLMLAKGIGKKAAERIVLELKGKLDDIADAPAPTSSGETSASSNKAEAISGLQFLGYSRAQAQRAVAGLDSSLPVEELIRAALERLFSE